MARLSVLLFATVAAVVLAAVVAGEPRVHPDQVPSYSFDRYVSEFGREYEAGSEEYMARSILFKTRVADMIAHNADPKNTYTRTINRFTDRTDDERSALLGARLHHGPAPALRQEYVEPPRVHEKLPESVDWRGRGVLTGVKDQGQCGSCWAHAAAETIESHVALATGQLPVLSQQQIASCTSNPRDCGGNGGCGGGIAELAYASVASMGGISNTWTYPYMSYWGENYSCMFNNTNAKKGTPAVANIKGYVKLPTNNYTALMDNVANVGPVAISVDASEWFEYHSGVYNGCTGQTTIDHAVQLVGYGTDATGGPYWTVRNSWGTAFGEDGYIRVQRHTSNPPCALDTDPAGGNGCKDGPTSVMVCGSCGILADSSYPTGASA